jgi:flagellar motor switch protein FliN
MDLQFLVEQFVQQLSQALEMMAGKAPSIHSSAGNAPAPDAGLAVWEQGFNIKGALAWFVGGSAAWTALGVQMLQGAGISDGDDAMAKSTLIESLNQAFAGVATASGNRIRKEVLAENGREITEIPDRQTWFRLTVEFAGASAEEFLVAFNAAFTSPPVEEQAVMALAEYPKEPAGSEVPINIPGIQTSRTLDLLLDVELPISVSFGRAQLTLKEVVKLTTGSIVELNRTVGEPVEVIVNNCVIARGEVVVVEGNFGVRIQQVISKQERLRTLY